MEQYNSDHDVGVLANSDIYFDKTLKRATDYLADNRDTAFAISRYDIQKNGKLKKIDVAYSQDTWMIVGKPKNITNIHFHLGVLGCDEMLACELSNAGYKVINPANSIITSHLHLSNYRTYNEGGKIEGKILSDTPSKHINFFERNLYEFLNQQVSIMIECQSLIVEGHVLKSNHSLIKQFLS